MKRIVQLILFFFLFLSFFIFYKLYLKNNTNKNYKELIINPEELTNKNENIIKNLNYEITLKNNQKYIISSKKSEVKNINNIEKVFMENVVAKLILEKENEIIINSDFAIYDDGSFDTKFYQNVKILYMNDIIYADNLDFIPKKNSVKIYNNVNFIGNLGKMKTDMIDINLITKDIDIKMNNKKNNILINTN